MELKQKKEELETKRKGILNQLVLATSYNRDLESKKINTQQYELELQLVNKELKEVNLLIGQQNKEEQESFPEQIKELLAQAKENYKKQVQNIRNEYLKIKELKENLEA